MLLDKNVAIVTGGARGIGAATVRRLAADGAIVAALDIDPDALIELGELKNTWSPDVAERVFSIQVDITDFEQVAACVSQIDEELGRIDILVNNAGSTGGQGKTWEVDLAQWHQMYNVLIHGAFYMMHEVIPVMLRASYGRIVNVASVAGKEGNPNSAAYSSAKAALIGLTKSTGKELAQSGILVNAVTPTVIETRMNNMVDPRHHEYLVSKIPMGRIGQPEEVAEMIAFLSSPRVSFSTAAVFDLSGGRTTY